MNNLKQIGLALHNFHDVNKRFPAGGTRDGNGKPLLSWRVHILPYLDQKALYDQFRLNEPWDSEHNKKLISPMPAVFVSPSSRRSKSDGCTVYREIAGDHTVFPPGVGIAISQIKDGTSNTIMLVEADDSRAVPWTKPEGIPYQNENPAAGWRGQFPNGFNALFGDGSVRFLGLPIDAEVLRRLLLIDDGKPIPSDF
jgi:prepilin-type processing-associated H-X9-DG protein